MEVKPKTVAVQLPPHVAGPIVAVLEKMQAQKLPNDQYMVMIYGKNGNAVESGCTAHQVTKMVK